MLSLSVLIQGSEDTSEKRINYSVIISLGKFFKPLKEMNWETIRNNRASFNIVVITSGHDSLQKLWNSLWILLPEFIILKAMHSATVTVQVNVLGVTWQKGTLR